MQRHQEHYTINLNRPPNVKGHSILFCFVCLWFPGSLSLMLLNIGGPILLYPFFFSNSCFGCCLHLLSPVPHPLHYQTDTNFFHRVGQFSYLSMAEESNKRMSRAVLFTNRPLSGVGKFTVKPCA